MELSYKLLKSFANIIDNPSKNRQKESTINGTATVKNGNKYVKLDGSSILTPISEATDIQDGDRVLVSIKNHTATVIGNYTCPASARTASSFLRLTDVGLLVGPLDRDGNVKGTGSLISPGVYYIVNEKGEVLSSFSPDVISLGDTKAILKLCGGKSKIYSSEKGGVALEADEGIALSAPICSVNGSEIVTTKKMIMSGSITATGSIKANSAVTISSVVKPNEGYVLAGIREIKSNHDTACVITNFQTNPSTNTVSVRLRNTSNSEFTDLTVVIEWFALYSNGSSYTVDDVLTFTDETETETGSQVEDTTYKGCYYRMVDGEQEWFNPPMVLGKEYRTVERHQGEVVYTKLVDGGALPNTSAKTISLGATIPNIISINAIVEDGTYTENLPYVNASGTITAFFYVKGSKGTLRTFADLSSYNAKIHIKYTKPEEGGQT